MHCARHYETKAIFLVQSSEQRKVCLNKAQISRHSRAYQLTTKHNLEAALQFTSLQCVGTQAGLLLCFARQAARRHAQTTRGRQVIRSSVRGVQVFTAAQCTGSQGPLPTSQPACCRERPCMWLNHWTVWVRTKWAGDEAYASFRVAATGQAVPKLTKNLSVQSLSHHVSFLQIRTELNYIRWATRRMWPQPVLELLKMSYLVKSQPHNDHLKLAQYRLLPEGSVKSPFPVGFHQFLCASTTIDAVTCWARLRNQSVWK